MEVSRGVTGVSCTVPVFVSARSVSVTTSVFSIDCEALFLRWVRSSPTSLSSADVAISLRSADQRVNWASYHTFPTKLGIILWPVRLVVPEDTDSQYSHKIKMSTNYEFSHMIKIFLRVLTEHVFIYHLSKCMSPICSNDMKKTTYSRNTSKCVSIVLAHALGM